MIRKWMALAACCLVGAVSLAAAADPVPCCTATKAVCQPTLVKATVTKRVYGEKTVEYCETCTAFSCLFPGKCCSRVKTKKVLILRLRKTEKLEPKCVPVHVPVCSAGCNAAPCMVAPSAPATLPATVSASPTHPTTMPPGK